MRLSLETFSGCRQRRYVVLPQLNMDIPGTLRQQVGVYNARTDLGPSYHGTGKRKLMGGKKKREYGVVGREGGRGRKKRKKKKASNKKRLTARIASHLLHLTADRGTAQLECGPADHGARTISLPGSPLHTEYIRTGGAPFACDLLRTDPPSID